MHRLVPDFIIAKWAAGETGGEIEAASLFVDISGFSAMTDLLMEHGHDGAETLARVMREAFTPLIAAVYEQGGFVVTHGGDSFTALFPAQDAPDYLQRALAAGAALSDRAQVRPSYKTALGEFAVSARAGVGMGCVRWGIVASTDRRRAAYYFTGAAIDAAVEAEQEAGPAELVVHSAVRERLPVPFEAEPKGKHWRVICAPEDLPRARPVHLSPPDPDITGRFYPRIPQDAAFGGEFRQVTNVFVRLPGIFGEAQLYPLMQTVFALQDRYGGEVRLQFGDKGLHLLLLWGAPVAHENDVSRALGFVLDLQAETALPINAGVTLRLAHAGFIGSELSEEYTAFGRGVNLAARFMTSAPRGEIWLDQYAAKRAAAGFEIEYVGQQQFKGFAEPQDVYMLVERKQQIEAFYMTPLAGREPEVRRLEELTRPVFAGRYAGLVGVWGEAGAGKSRLVHEFLGRLSLNGAGHQAFICQTDEILREPFNPFRYWLKNYFGISDAVAAARNKRSFNRVIDDLVSAAPAELGGEIDRTRSFLAALAGLYWPDSLYEQRDAQARYDNTLLALTSLLQAESLLKPVILFVEDVHWLDSDSWAFLARLDASLRGSDRGYPIAVIMSGRFRELALPPDLTVGSIVLEGLDREGIRELAEGQLGAPAGDGIVALLLARAEGNPFFAEQILAYIKEAGSLRPEEHGWELASHASLQLPEDVQALLVARLDRLEHDVRDVVQTAAILGREFEVELLSQMLRSDLVALKVAEAEQHAIWFALSELRYLFHHALLRDAAYQMQLSSRRQRLHALAVDALELLYKDDLKPRYAELAHHAEHAGRLDVARGYLRLAADAARDAYQNAQAVEYYTRLLDLLPPKAPAERWDALVERERLIRNLGLWERRRDDIAWLEALAETSEDRGKRAYALGCRGDLLAHRGEHDLSATVCREAIEEARAAGRRDVEAEALITLGQQAMHQGRYAEANQQFAEALDLARAIRDGRLELMAVNLQGLNANFGGDFRRARACHEEVLRFAEQTGNLRYQALAQNNLALTVGAEGDLMGALERYREAARLAHDLGDRYGQATATANVGWIAAQVGDYAAATRTTSQSLAMIREIGKRPEEPAQLLNLGIVAEAQGDYDDAEGFLREAEELSREFGNRAMQGYSLTYLAYVYSARNRISEAREAVEAALALRRALGHPALILETLAAHAYILCLAGDSTGAAACVEEILAAMGGPGLAQRRALDGAEQPLRVVRECYRVLQAAGDSRAGELLLAGCSWLEEKASGLAPSFRSAIPWHRELLGAAAALRMA